MAQILPLPSKIQIADSAPPISSLIQEPFIATEQGIHLSISVTEPVLFLEGYKKDDPSTKKCTVLRGQLHLKLTEVIKVKKIWVRFRGQIQMEWPEGECMGKRTLFTQGATYFDRGDTVIKRNIFGADFVQLSDVAYPAGENSKVIASKQDALLYTNKSLASKRAKCCSLESDFSGEVSRKCLKPNTAQCQPNYISFPAGDYLYSFEFLVDGSLPETIATDLSSIHYNLEASIEPLSSHRSPLTGNLDIPVVRLPMESSLSEPITISRIWRDQLRYRVDILAKSFPLGSRIPISLKVSSMANLVCDWIKVYVTEHVQYWTSGKGSRRLQLPTRKVLLFEKNAGLEGASTYPGSEMHIISDCGMGGTGKGLILNSNNANLLGDISSDTEIELKIQLPSCPEMKRRDKCQWLHFDTDGASLKVNHWIQIVLRLSKLENGDPSWNKPVEMTLESPFQILSCKATPANIFVPAYAEHSDDPANAVQRCRCDCAPAGLSTLSSSAQDAVFQLHDNSMSMNKILSQRSTLSFNFLDKSCGIKPPPQAYLRERNSNGRHSLQLYGPLNSARGAVEDIELRPPPLTSPKYGWPD